MKIENIYQQVMEMLGKSLGNFSIVEEQIDLNDQMEYFESSAAQKDKFDEQEVLDEREKLFDDSIDIDERKRILVQLGSLDKVEAYRTIERFAQLNHPELHQWAVLALRECRMHLESTLLQENQVIITTGLGGKGNKLRFFVLIMSNTGSELTEVQKKIVRNELGFILPKYNCEAEELTITGNYCTIVALIPINASIRSVFDEVIHECNQIGNFLSSNFVVTNVKALTDNEINEFLLKQDKLRNKND